VVHAFLFGIFSYLLAVVLFDVKKLKKNSVLSLSLFMGVLYSAASEFLQNYIPGRTVSEYDFLGGVVGVIVFIFIVNLRYGKR
jgi:VanZ family protein